MPSTRKLGPVVAALVAVALVVSAAPARAQVGSTDPTTADPPLARPSTRPCVVTLFDGLVFADYSPKPFAYAPPTGCAGPWEKIVLTADFDVTAGRQFDRTANIWIGGANVYFGTTAEPSRNVARAWHVERDLTDYAALLATAQPGEVDLGNTVDATYTGILHGSARLEIYPARHPRHAARTPDVVLPLSDRATGGTVALPAPSSTLARTFTLPRNIERAYLDVIAQSQGGDEFWYLCAPNDVAGQLQSCGGTGFRETEVSIDGQPAGVAPIYPWIYTGGIDPFLWEPIPGVQTLGLAPYRVDLTPFAGLLSDGQAHEIALAVFNSSNYFSATASLLLYLDRDAGCVEGAVTRNTLAAPVPTVKEELTTAADGTVSGTVTVSSARRFVIAGYVDTSHGRVRTEIAERLEFTNRQRFDVSGTQYVQRLEQRTTIASETRRRTRGERRELVQRASWPLAIDFSYIVAGDGTATQTTRVTQAREGERRAADDGWLDDFGVAASRVSTQDTLTFAASGALTGQKDQRASHAYFAANGAGGCYSRTVDAAGGKITAVADGAECGP